jgi:hypothetical protein
MHLSVINPQSNCEALLLINLSSIMVANKSGRQLQFLNLFFLFIFIHLLLESQRFFFFCLGGGGGGVIGGIKERERGKLFLD